MRRERERICKTILNIRLATFSYDLRAQGTAENHNGAARCLSGRILSSLLRRNRIIETTRVCAFLSFISFSASSKCSLSLSLSFSQKGTILFSSLDDKIKTKNKIKRDPLGPNEIVPPIDRLYRIYLAFEGNEISKIGRSNLTFPTCNVHEKRLKNLQFVYEIPKQVFLQKKRLP